MRHDVALEFGAKLVLFADGSEIFIRVSHPVEGKPTFLTPKISVSIVFLEALVKRGRALKVDTVRIALHDGHVAVDLYDQARKQWLGWLLGDREDFLTKAHQILMHCSNVDRGIVKA